MPSEEDASFLEDSLRVVSHHIVRETEDHIIKLLLADYFWKRRRLNARLRASYDDRVKTRFLPSDIRTRFEQEDDQTVTENTLAADVGIVTINRTELDAALLAFDVPLTTEPRIIGNEAYWTGLIWSDIENRDLRFVITMVGEQRNSECASATERLLSRYAVKVCFLCGIAAGLREKVTLGDVLISEEIVDYEGARLQPEGPMIRPQRHTPPPTVLADMRLYESGRTTFDRRFDQLLSAASSDWLPKRRGRKPIRPSQYRARIATGEKLVANDLLGPLRAQHDERIRGLDMESHGFAIACQSHTPPVAWLVFRGISDYGQTPKEQDWQHVAALAAASMLADFIKTRYRPDPYKF